MPLPASAEFTFSLCRYGYNGGIGCGYESVFFYSLTMTVEMFFYAGDQVEQRLHQLEEVVGRLIRVSYCLGM